VARRRRFGDRSWESSMIEMKLEIAELAGSAA
jgi:hypothetical protein